MYFVFYAWLWSLNFQELNILRGILIVWDCWCISANYQLWLTKYNLLMPIAGYWYWENEFIDTWRTVIFTFLINMWFAEEWSNSFMMYKFDDINDVQKQTVNDSIARCGWELFKRMVSRIIIQRTKGLKYFCVFCIKYNFMNVQLCSWICLRLSHIRKNYITCSPTLLMFIKWKLFCYYLK